MTTTTEGVAARIAVWRWIVAIGGVVLLLAYALPLLAPPPPRMPAAALSGADLWERIFPGVPASWVILRLYLVLLGALLLVTALGRGLALSLDTERPSPHLEAAMWSRILAGFATAVVLYYAPGVPGFDRHGEALWFYSIGLPALLLASGEGVGWYRQLRPHLRSIGGLMVLPGLWLAFSIASAWRSPRAASIVDMWIMIDRLRDVVTGAKKALSDSATPGHSNAYMMLEGLPWMGEHASSVTYVGLQAAHLGWGIACGIAIGLVAWRLLDRRAAPVAQAVFLFSPYVLAAAYSPGPTLIAPLCIVLLLGLWLAARDHGSLAAIAAFAAVAGLSGTEPTAALIGLLMCAVLGWTLLRARPLPWFGLVLAPLLALAATLPALPNLETLSLMADKYTFGRRQLAGIQSILFGQESPLRVMEYMSSAAPSPYDLPIGALLAPVAIARTPLRLWGDCLLDPIGAALAATGILLCLVNLGRNPAARILVAILLLSLLQASTAAGDAVSHGRLAAALVPLALLAAAAFSGLQRFVGRSGAATALVVMLVAGGGSMVFTVINPRILAASWMTISLQAIGAAPRDADPVIIGHSGTRNINWLFIERIAALLPSPAIPVYSVDSLRAASTSPPENLERPPRVYFWSPALEATEGPDRILCTHHPGAALFRITDEAHLYTATAAVPRGAAWQPRVARERWSVYFCDAPQCGGVEWTPSSGVAASP